MRDLRIARSYRSPFILEVVEALFAAALFFYASRFVDSPQLRASLPQGNSYFAYALIGFLFFDYLTAALDIYDRTLTEARDTGTLEPLLVTQVSLPIVLAGSALYPFASTTLRIAVYLAWGALLFGFPLASANWLSVFVVVLATLLAFSALGNIFCKLSPALQARQSRQVVHPRRLQRGRRNALPHQHPARLAPIHCSSESCHLRPRRYARRSVGRLQYHHHWPPSFNLDSVRRRAPTLVYGHFLLGTSAHQNEWNSHP